MSVVGHLVVASWIFCTRIFCVVCGSIVLVDWVVDMKFLGCEDR